MNEYLHPEGACIDETKSFLNSGKIPFASLEELHLAGHENSDYEILVSSLAAHHGITLEEAERRVRQDHERGPYVNQAATAFIKCLIEGAEIQGIFDKHPEWIALGGGE